MKLELSFPSCFEDKQIILNICLDYMNHSYGWNTFIKYSNDQISYYEYGIPCKKIQIWNQEEVVEQPRVPNILSVDEFIDKLPDLRECVFYTGAGISVAAGVWDLVELRHNLLLDEFDKFEQAVINKNSYFIDVCRTFAKQLNDTTPTIAHDIITQLQQQYHCNVFTENLDVLHQKAGTKVFIRDGFRISQLLTYKKHLVIIGMSKDHSKLIRQYRDHSGNRPIFVINQNVIPEYVREGDYYVSADVQDFLKRLEMRL